MAAVIFSLAYAALLTLAQYRVWAGSEFSRPFINSPVAEVVPLPEILRQYVFSSKLGYFLFYSFGRFWLGPLISLLAAAAFYIFLRSLKKYQERFFEDGETELGFLAALIAGWPAFIVFLLLVFPGVVLVAIYRRLFTGEMYTTLGWPLVLAALASLLWGKSLIIALGLRVLFI